ncbi:MAG: glycosyltransferase [Candidatus Pacearchaeota archaeon]
MENFPKVLVAAPTYEGMKYCEKEFLESIKNFDYPNYDILLVDNSKTEDYFNHLKEDSKIKVIRIDEGEKNMQRLINSRNKIMDYALKNNYDYIFMLDSDVICPKGIIKELLFCNKEIVSGIYFNLFKVNGKLEEHPVAWKSITEKDFEEIKKEIELPEFIKSHLDLRRHLTKEEIESNELIEVIIPSAGCLLIKRNVFEKINYGLLDTKKYNNIQTGEDIFFILNAKEKGFKSYCNTKIKCKHILDGKFRIDEKGVKHHPMYD